MNIFYDKENKCSVIQMATAGYSKDELSVSVDGSRIKVKASSYAKSVEILNENEDLILSDNYFDLNADERIVEVISGDISNLRVRSVYDIH